MFCFPFSFLCGVTFYLQFVPWSSGLNMIYPVPLILVWLQMLTALRNSPNSMTISSMKDCIDPNLMDLYPHDCLYKVLFNCLLITLWDMLLLVCSFFWETSPCLIQRNNIEKNMSLILKILNIKHIIMLMGATNVSTLLLYVLPQMIL